MEIYPIMISGEQCGELRVHREGLFTVFEADMDRVEGIVRLSVFGGGHEGNLGIPAPKDGRLYMKRRLSAAEMRDYPQKIEYAAPSGEIPVPKPEPLQEASPAEPEYKSDLLWFSTPDGVLVSFDGTRNLVAVPSDAPGAPSGIKRIIGGREYVIFPGRPGHK